MDKELRNVLIVCGAMTAVLVAVIVVGAVNASTSPDRVVTCKILTKSVSTDEDTWTTLDTDRCGVLFDEPYARETRDLEVGHVYRIRVHDVHRIASDRTHVVEVEGEVR